MAKDKDISGLLDGAFKPRSTLAAWMKENHDAFHKRVSTQIPDWHALASAFAKEGLTNRLGKPPQAEATRKMWRQIHRDVVASRSDPATKPNVSVKPSAQVPRPTPAPADDDEDPDAFFRTISKPQR